MCPQTGRPPASPGLAVSFEVERRIGLIEELVAGTRQAEVVTQRGSLVAAAQETAPLQFRYNLFDEVVEASGEVGNITVNPSQAPLVSQSSISSAMVFGVPRIESPP